jgi:hypothetical protein
VQTGCFGKIRHLFHLSNSAAVDQVGPNNGVLSDRQNAVETLLGMKRGEIAQKKMRHQRAGHGATWRHVSWL